MTDTEILALFQARDEQALHAVRQQYGALCTGIALRILGDRQDAEECFNDVLWKLWASIPPEQPRSLAAYIAALTRNLCLDRYAASRTAKRGGGQIPAALEELAGYVASPEQTEDIVSGRAVQAAILRFLESLPKKRRLIFLARFWSFLPIEEIAQMYGMTAGAVKMSLRRTKEKLRKHLKQEGLL